MTKISLFAGRSGREQYGDDAIGYVQLKRASNQCEVWARVTPEHKVTSKGYRVTVMINEEEEEVNYVQCLDCVASQGGCKHGVALLMWLHRRSSEPSVTDIQAYWKKPRLSMVGGAIKAVPAGDLRPNPRDLSSGSATPGANMLGDAGEYFFSELMEEVRGSETGASGLLFDYFAPSQDAWEGCTMDHLLDAYLGTCPRDVSARDFILFAKNRMTPAMCQAINKETRAQHQSSMWHAMRFGRITASKLHEAAHCQTKSGSLVMSVIGAAKLKDNAAMQRGRELEPQVLKMVSKKVGKVEGAGLVLRPDLPIFGASPDGLTSDGRAVVEVKCPSSEKTLRRYIAEEQTMAKKHRAQVQLLMLMTRRDLAYFCVADPGFPQKAVYICKERYDEGYCRDLIQTATKFWCENVFPELVKGRGVGLGVVTDRVRS